MPVELTVLALAGILQAVQWILVAIPAMYELGPSKMMSARDRSRIGGSIEEQMSEKTARLYRAHNNHFEGLILFTLAVVVVILGNKTSTFTAGCAWTYLIARMLYIPAYYFGLRPWRSYIWFLASSASILMILSALTT